MADLAVFENEFMLVLKSDRLLFISEIVQMGKKYGLSESQVQRILEQAESLTVGFRDVVFVCAESEQDNGSR